MRDGTDVTDAYDRGARLTCAIAAQTGAEAALMKARSPSCGCGGIYDGTFSGTLIDGNGVTAELLLQAGIQVFGESQISQFYD
jgi:uncharacterized protein YbbK (DUF523 family)